MGRTRRPPGVAVSHTVVITDGALAPLSFSLILFVRVDRGVNTVYTVTEYLA